jgi:hypothetical protein
MATAKSLLLGPTEFRTELARRRQIEYRGINTALQHRHQRERDLASSIRKSELSLAVQEPKWPAVLGVKTV